jgi:hypothetical protein
MTRAFLKSLLPNDLEGLDGIIDSIINAHGEGVEREKSKTNAVTEQAKEQAEAHKKTLDDTKRAYEEKLSARGDESEAETKLKTLQEEYEKAKETHATELKAATDAHDATKAEHEAVRTNGAMDAAVSAALKTAGYSEAAIPLFLKAGYDREQLKKEADGSFSNIDKLVETLKADPVNGTFFGKMQTEGANVGGSQQQQTTTLTREAVAKMSPEEINKNWDAVQAALK